MNEQRSESALVDQEPTRDLFLAEILSGLQQTPKKLPSKYFYDQRGSQLFDRICEVDEYYVTRTELAIMRDFAPQMAAQIGRGVMLIEYGNGSSVKTRLLLNHLEDLAAYVPVDISRKHLEQACARLAGDYPALEVIPVSADFTTPFDIPTPVCEPTHTAVYFPGSTIGNFSAQQAERLLSQIATQCGAGGGLLIGIDLQKDPNLLVAAYNDSQGVTAEFNLNLLRRVNRELDGNFQMDRFRHRAIYDTTDHRIEMYLESLEPQSISIANQVFSLAEGEMICTEYSHKYTTNGFARMAEDAGLTLQRQWSDEHHRLAVLYFTITD